MTAATPISVFQLRLLHSYNANVSTSAHIRPALGPISGKCVCVMSFSCVKNHC